MRTSGQKSGPAVWVLVGMAVSSSFTGSPPASAQSPSEVAQLVTQLHDESPSVRWAAAYALGGIGPAAKAAAPELVRLLNDPDKGVRGSAAYALGRIGPAAEAAAPELVRLLNDPDK